MRRAEAIRRLRDQQAALREMGATSLYMFGSTARDEAGQMSDLDLFVDYDPDGAFSLIDLLRIRQHIVDELGVGADVTTRAGLHPLIRDDVVASAARVF